MTVALETQGLEKHFGGLKVTRDLSLRIEQGATTMPIVLNEPEEIGAAMSPIACTTSARARTAAGLRSVSTAKATSAARVTTRCVSIGNGRNSSSSRTP